MLLFLLLKDCIGLNLCLAICFATGFNDAKTSISGSRFFAIASIIDRPLAIVTTSFGRITPYSCIRLKSASKTPSKRLSLTPKYLPNKSFRSLLKLVVSMS